MAVRPVPNYTVDSRADVYNPTVVQPHVRRVSWAAILAGAVIALVTMFALYMLGLAIGAATVNPLQEIDPIEPALGTGTVVWLAASTLIGLFLGGFTAGRMSGIANDDDGVLHGLVTWAVVTALTLVMLTTSIGSIINGVTNAFASVVSGAADVAPEVASALNVQDGALTSIQNEARDLFATENADGEAVAADSPMTLDQFEVNRAISTFLMSNPDDITETDRENLATLIAERTDLSAQEARERLDRWEAAFVEVREDAETAARSAAQAVADATTLLAGAIFAAMVVGAFAAGAGGYVGVENFKQETGLDEDRDRDLRPTA